MKVVGLTGGIGSGKSTIATFFKQLGVSVYDTDTEAKFIMLRDPNVKQRIIDLLGTEAYKDGLLNRSFIADHVFNDAKVLQQLNAIVHPAVANHFEQWKDEQKSSYVVKETAILFENEGNLHCEYTILVCAPIEMRIARVLERDQTTREKVYDRIKNQWSDEKKIPLADFVIDNISLSITEKQVLDIHNEIKDR